MSAKYDLAKSKETIGPLYPRLLDKQGREIDGFHREEASEDWPIKIIEEIDTDVKYWTARIVANTHRRKVSKEERKNSIIELAKALRDEGCEGSLVDTISKLTTFSNRYVRGLLPDEFKQTEMARESAELSTTTEQTSNKETRIRTSDKEKLDNLYKKVEKSAFSGQRSTTNKYYKAKEIGLDVSKYETELNEIKTTLRNSIGRRYEDVRDSLKKAYKKSVEMKKTLTAQINIEKERRKQVKEDLKNEVIEEVSEEVTQEILEMTEAERINELLKDIPQEFEILKSWAIEGYWGTEALLDLINKPVSRDRIRKILIDGSEEQIQKVKEGKLRVNNVWSQIRGEEKKNNPIPNLPDGIYDVIYADPPWKYDYGGSMRGKAEMHYPTMELDEIIGLQVNDTSIKEKISDNAMLFLWTTNPFLEDALKVIKAWGFEYKTNFAWIKKHIGTGFYVRSQHEILLIARKGNIGFPADADRPPSLIKAPKTEHSAKPNVVYDLIEKMYPNHRYLELFARNQRSGWVSWGNEVGS